MRVILAIVAASMLVGATARAQSIEPSGTVPEFRPFVGVYLPTGDQGDLLKNAVLAGGQVGVEMADMLHLIGTFAWSPTEEKDVLFDNGVNVFQYDAGLEIFRSQALGENWLFRPFAGAGLGARTYSLRDVNADSKTYFAGYGAMGAELQLNRLAVRLEGRDYVTRFKGLAGQTGSSTRNDLMLAMGLSVHLR